MKPIHLKPDQSVVFVAMKIQPKDNNWYPDRYNNGEWWCFWGKKGTDVENKCHLPEFKPPYRPGEICYVREAWLITDLMNKPITKNYKGELWVFRGKPDIDMKSRVIYQADHPGKWKGAWRSPVTMPQWASRRHVRIVSCEPVKVKDVSLADIEAIGIPDDRATGNAPKQLDKFKAYWQSKHPDKQWAWRVITEEVQD